MSTTASEPAVRLVSNQRTDSAPRPGIDGTSPKLACLPSPSNHCNTSERINGTATRSARFSRLPGNRGSAKVITRSCTILIEAPVSIRNLTGLSQTAPGQVVPRGDERRFGPKLPVKISMKSGPKIASGTASTAEGGVTEPWGRPIPRASQVHVILRLSRRKLFRKQHERRKRYPNDGLEPGSHR
jgi:hypothetical protein